MLVQRAPQDQRRQAIGDVIFVYLDLMQQYNHCIHSLSILIFTHAGPPVCMQKHAAPCRRYIHVYVYIIITFIKCRWGHHSYQLQRIHTHPARVIDNPSILPWILHDVMYFSPLATISSVQRVLGQHNRLQCTCDRLEVHNGCVSDARPLQCDITSNMHGHM